MGNSADIRLTERSRATRPAQAEERTVPSTAHSAPVSAAPKEPCDMTLEELFVRFENDMIYDAHSYGARYSRSEARREIQRRGTDPSDSKAGHRMIYAIIEFLRSGRSSDETVCRDYVDGGWAVLAAAIARREPVH